MTRGVVVEVVDEVIGFGVDADVVDDFLAVFAGANRRPMSIVSPNVVSVVAGVFVDDKS